MWPIFNIPIPYSVPVPKERPRCEFIKYKNKQCENNAVSYFNGRNLCILHGPTIQDRQRAKLMQTGGSDGKS